MPRSFFSSAVSFGMGAVSRYSMMVSGVGQMMGVPSDEAVTICFPSGENTALWMS